MKDVCDVELTGGNEMVLANGATLYFLGTSAATAQSYTGNLYFDEFFWVSNFLNLRRVAAGMATHDKAGLTLTYFSTPSSEEHEAYSFWTGDLFNKHLPALSAWIFRLRTPRSAMACCAGTGHGGKY